jgi:hypothetical protein
VLYLGPNELLGVKHEGVLPGVEELEGSTWVEERYNSVYMLLEKYDTSLMCY